MDAAGALHHVMVRRLQRHGGSLFNNSRIRGEVGTALDIGHNVPCEGLTPWALIESASFSAFAALGKAYTSRTS
jgi:hypothetical protein